MNSSINRFLPPLPALSGVFGILLLLPASGFLLALLVRICFGATAWYHSMSPSFLQSPFDLFAWHKAQFIIVSLLLAIIFNVLTIVRVHLERGQHGLEVGFSYRRYWLNAAITLQSTLLLLILVVYTFIQHIRY